jgi:hypothetical protein
MYKVKLFTIILPLLLCMPLVAQAKGGDDDKGFVYTDRIYRDNIKTAQVHQTSWMFSPPIIQLGAHQKLQLDFDDLDGDYKSYYYTFIHCDANWQASDINSMDYMRGFDQAFLNTYDYSFNTSQKYTHYTLIFPNKDIQLLLSGNYIVKVYLNNAPDSIVLTKRFMIYEDLVTIHPREKEAIGEDMYTKQEINFSINTSRYKVLDPFHAMQVFISQDWRWDNAINNLQPQFIQDTALQYFQDDGNSFDGGNYFRNFDMTSLRYNTEHIEGKIANPTGEEIQLKKDVPRTTEPYFTYPDIQGQYKIMTKDADSSTINSEYVWVHFFMPMDSAMKGGKLYIFGQLSDWQCKPEFEMTYDDVLAAYTAKVLLKQGYYDYEYAFLKNGSSIADATVIEGSHMEQENNYYILVYNREIGLYYDRLIGYVAFHGP